MRLEVAWHGLCKPTCIQNQIPKIMQLGAPLEAEVHTVAMESPNDVSRVMELFDRGIVDPAHVIAVIAQTEGRDQERADAALALQDLLGTRLGVSREVISETVPMLMIGGTAGLMCPHFTLFVNKPATRAGQPGVKRLVVAAGSTRALQLEEYGTLSEVKEVARVVNEVTLAAGITDPADVQSIQLKTPAPTLECLLDAALRGQPTCSQDPLTVAAMTRGAAALGAAVALGEIDSARISNEIIGQDASLYTRKAFASAGAEQAGIRVLVIGNVAGAPGRLYAASGVMSHQLDVRGARQVFKDAGFALADGILAEHDRQRLRAVFVKAGADAVGDVLGRRHTMCSDFLSAYSGHQAKAIVHAIVSSITGDTLVLANAGPEHQGKLGSNLLCVIAGD